MFNCNQATRLSLNVAAFNSLIHAVFHRETYSRVSMNLNSLVVNAKLHEYVSNISLCVSSYEMRHEKERKHHFCTHTKREREFKCVEFLTKSIYCVANREMLLYFIFNSPFANKIKNQAANWINVRQIQKKKIISKSISSVR